ncbi:MAG: DUF4251 domain-containing protein [Pedobacter sp.]|nr:MAG: DUF4251 domain-containing protein [Pedobacter sp.]
MKRSFLFIALFLFAGTVAFGQAGAEKLPGLLKSKKFTFYATSALPQNSAEIARAMRNIPGGSASNIQLDALIYDVVVKPDTISSWLPYYGRTYVPSLDRDDRGIIFDSKDFTYEETTSKKGVTTITMKFNDVKLHQRMMLTITKSGYATLNVTSVDRSNITFNGYVDATKPPKAKKQKAAR